MRIVERVPKYVSFQVVNSCRKDSASLKINFSSKSWQLFNILCSPSAGSYRLALVGKTSVLPLQFACDGKIADKSTSWWVDHVKSHKDLCNKFLMVPFVNKSNLHSFVALEFYEAIEVQTIVNGLGFCPTPL